MSIPSRALVVTCVLVAACSADAPDAASVTHQADSFNPMNHPTRVRWDYESDFYALPLAHRASKTPWSDDYWAFSNGGIAYRWQTGQTPFEYRTGPTPEAVRMMSQAELAKLSPAEKYDVYTGRYDYPTVSELLAITRPDAEYWEGFCDGWANAAIHYAEPGAVTLAGRDGVKVPFASSDVKALLTYFQSRKAVIARTRLGEVCQGSFATNPALATTPACEDTNAGSFHLMLGNLLGREDTPFVGDVTRDGEVWNQPFHSYESRVERTQAPSPGASPEAMKEAVVTTKLTYTVEVRPHQTPNHADVTLEYRYRLELDANDAIVGGSSISDARPDFIWTNPKTEFYGAFEPLGEIYRAAIPGGAP